MSTPLYHSCPKAVEHDAFESADRSASEAALPVLEVIRKMARLQPNERTCAFLINEIRYMVDNCNWKHTEHAKSVSDLLSSAVSELEAVSDAKIREVL